jgi:hypothetical protein
VDRLILRCLPEEVRARYAEEIQELLDRSPHPLRDRADLVVAAIGLRLGSRLSPCLVVSTGCLGLSLAAVVHSIAHVRGGAVEVLDHWWSTFAIGGFGASIVTVALLSTARRQAHSWGR